MNKKEVFDELRSKRCEAHKKDINYDELSAYVLTLLQFNIQLIFEKEGKVVGVGPRGVLYRLGNMLYQYADYPEQLNAVNGAILACIDGVLYSLFDNTLRIKRPAKKGCSFGKEMESISESVQADRHADGDLEFE